MGSSRHEKELEQRVSRLEGEIEVLRRENDDLAMRVRDLEREAETRPGAATDLDSAAMPPRTAVAFTARCHPAAKGTHYELTKDDAAQLFSNGAGLATQARVVPYFVDGKARGFKVFAIRKDSFYSSCGFKNGDAIESVNGEDISSPDKALEAYTHLRDATSFDVKLLRQGVESRIVIDLKG